MLFYLQLIGDEGDKPRFEQLYWLYRGLMFHAAKKLLHNDQDAEDAVHLAFMAILKNFKNISHIDCPETRAYVVIIVESKSLDILRQRKRRGTAALDEAAVGLETPLPGDGGLADALAQLPARYRQVLLLRFAQGYSSREIGKMLGLSQASTQKLIWRAKEALRQQLQKEAGNDGETGAPADRS